VQLQVIAETMTEVTRARDPHDPWDADDLHHVTDLVGVVAVDDDCHFDLVHPLPLTEGDQMFLVWGTYAVQDAYHSQTGLPAWIGVYSELWMAEACAGSVGKLVGQDLFDACRSISIPTPEGGWVSLPRGFYQIGDDEHPVLEAVHLSQVPMLPPAQALTQADHRHFSVSPQVLEPDASRTPRSRGR